MSSPKWFTSLSHESRTTAGSVEFSHQRDPSSLDLSEVPSRSLQSWLHQIPASRSLESPRYASGAGRSSRWRRSIASRGPHAVRTARTTRAHAGARGGEAGVKWGWGRGPIERGSLNTSCVADGTGPGGMVDLTTSETIWSHAMVSEDITMCPMWS